MPRVLHSHPTWLPFTQNWMYSQIVSLPSEWENAVVCEKVINQQYSLRQLYSLSSLPKHVEFFARAFRKARFRRDFAFYHQVARAFKPDIVHSHFGNVGWQDLPMVKHSGASHVVTFYGLDVNRLPRTSLVWRERYKELFHSADRFLCEGPHMASCLMGLGCPPEKITVHHLGINLERRKFTPREWRPGEPLRVLLASSFREKKGIPIALAALGKIKGMLNFEVTIIGDALDDADGRSEKASILQEAKKSGVAPRYMGYQPESVLIEQAYQNHIFIAPSMTARDGDTEGGAPVVVLEMAATGMPVLSTSHCDIPNIISHKETGYLASEGDPESLAQGLLWMAENKSRWSTMAHGARERLELEFDEVKQGRRLGDIYRSVQAVKKQQVRE